ncbi:PTS system mannose/fructose/N-acetylgalactosamine-transporter subunit IIB [Secundilactobacillus folii]|uniref:PTS fructose transporter subunit IIB n=1 Tax=Secundilactobacillus folii TaxID=2678357 RepID=A0A7X3C3J5_9LACO|nr:PTS sugar transporter subunit IIB [Secundilactobacillus folii]MTV82364.1 PTS fructose transporter subunit IIB [Secundilactobacillus folii]
MTMDIRLARIDSRLLHGQVATVWTKTVTPNRILVVSDKVAKDNLRKSLITQAAPPGVKANVITIKKMLAIYTDPRFDVFKTLLLTENAQDMAALVKGGIDLSKIGINVGSLAYQDGMATLTDAVAVDQTEAKALRYLASDAGLKVTIQKVPGDRQIDVLPLLDKNQL